MTTTTPESRGRIAYVAYLRGKYRDDLPGLQATRMFDEMPAREQEGWIKAANTIWDLRTTGTATV
jgi:hypothetical protein